MHDNHDVHEELESDDNIDGGAAEDGDVLNNLGAAAEDDEFGFVGNGEELAGDVDGDDDDDDPVEEFQNIEELDDYDTIFKFLTKEWMKVELNHNISKVASETLWTLAKTWFPRLFRAKEMQDIRRKTTSFVHIRRQMNIQFVPRITMKFAFENKETGVMTIVNDSEVTPKSRFPPNLFQKVWEIASIEVWKKSDLFLPKSTTLRT